MKKTLLLPVIALMLITINPSCKKDEPAGPTTKDITLNVTGLPDLGSDYMYEGWLIVGGMPVSTGRFSITSSGALSQSTFAVDADKVDNATKFVLTIEPANDSDPGPAATHVLSGDFSGNTASVSVMAELGDFSSASGTYILATPTNGMPSNENSGIWFLDITNGLPPAQGLFLPTLPAGWKYEGWVVINGTPVTTGKFTNPKATDEFDGYSDSMPLPDVNGADGFYPGEDFLLNAPAGLTFPTDIAGGKAVISIEPEPDNSPMPFAFKPLVGDIPANATDHVNYDMAQNLNFASGTVTRP